MQINEEVWGSKDNWSSPSYRRSIDGKTPESDRSSLERIWNNDYFPLGTPMDWSISPWGINAHSAVYPKYKIVYGDETNGYNVEMMPVHQFDDTLEVVDNIPFIFGASPSTSQYGTSIFQADYRYTPEMNSQPQGGGRYVEITSSFNYQKMLLVPMIWHTNANLSDGYYSNLNDFSNMDFTSNRYVIGIYYIWFGGLPGSRVGINNYQAILLRDLKVDRLDIDGYYMPYDNAHIVEMNNNDGRYWLLYDIIGDDSYSKSQIKPSLQEAINYTLADVDRPYGDYRRAYFCPDWFEPIITNLQSDSINVQVGKLVTPDNKDEVISNIMREVAYLGLPFSKGEYGSEATFLSEYIYLPKFDDDGITTGEYTNNAREKIEMPNFDWTDEIDSGYDWSKEESTSKYKAVDTVNEGGSALFSGLKTYYTDFVGVTNFISAINNNLDTNITLEDVVNRIVAFRSVPFVIPKVGLNQESVKLGQWDSNVEMYRAGLVNYIGAFASFGPVRVPKYYKNFLDYSPYTSLSLYCPFCGTIDLDTNVYIGHEITVKMAQDITTGEVMAYIFADEHLQDTMTGTGNVDIPLSGELLGSFTANQMRLQYEKNQNKYTGLTAVLGNLAGAGISASFGNAMGVGTQLAMGLENAGKYLETNTYIKEQLQRMTPTTTLIQKGTSALGTNLEPYPVLWINRTRLIKDFDNNGYGHNTGFACWKYGKLSEFSGLTQCVNPDLSGIPCTEEERQIISEFLKNGVRL